METRVAVMGIIVSCPDSVEKLNSLLHEYSKYIIGRMGIPYREKNISVVSVAIDAPTNASPVDLYSPVTVSPVQSRIPPNSTIFV